MEKLPNGAALPGPENPGSPQGPEPRPAGTLRSEAATRLTPQEAAHAASIGDENPTLAPIPSKAISKILVASVVRKPPEVVRAFLQTLAWQEFRKDTHLDFLFLDDTSQESYAAEVAALLAAAPGEVRPVAPSVGYAEYREHTGISRGWSPKAWHRVGALKDQIIQHALAGNYDGLWLVDADVLCSPHTLQSLMDASASIVSGVYWTFWTRRRETDSLHQHAGPQVWLRHPYSLDGRGWTEGAFRQALIDRGRVRVWGLGACTLVSRAALAKGVRFAPFGALPPGPMADGEDRHFCARANHLHLEMIADAWPNIYHAYHPHEYPDIPDYLEHLGAHTGWDQRPTRYTWVSARLRNLDMPNTPPTYVRGELGRLDIVPELRQALLRLLPGDKRLLKVHFPVHYPHDALRNKNCLMEVSLLDVQSHSYPPVIDQELLMGQMDYMDATQFTGAQLEEMIGEPTT